MSRSEARKTGTLRHKTYWKSASVTQLLWFFLRIKHENLFAVEESRVLGRLTETSRRERTFLLWNWETHFCTGHLDLFIEANDNVDTQTKSAVRKLTAGLKSRQRVQNPFYCANCESI